MNGTELSLWDRFKIAITPKSHAEAMVDAIYGPEGRGLIPIPETYEPESASTPAVMVETRQEIVESISAPLRAIASSAKTSFFVVGAVAFVAVAALVAINAYIKR